MAVTEKSSTQKLFERNLLVFSINSETPRFWDVEALIDSLARLVLTDAAAMDDYEFMLVRFSQDDLSIIEFQSKIRTLLELCPYPYPREYFAGFITLPLRNKRQEAAARRYVCSLVGLPERM